MCPEKDAELAQKSYKVRKQNMAQKPSQWTDLRVRLVGSGMLRGWSFGSKHEKKGNLYRKTYHCFRSTGRNSTKIHNSTLAKAAELIGYV